MKQKKPKKASEKVVNEQEAPAPEQPASAPSKGGFFRRLTRHWKKLVALILLAALGWWFVQQRNGNHNTEIFTVSRGDLQQFVSVTGQVQPSEAVELGFERSGKVAEVLVDIGDRVEAGQVLVTLENAELNAQVEQADAAIQSAQAQYQARLAELETARSEVTSAQAGVENEEAQLVQLQSALEEAQQQLAETKRGTRREEIQITQTTVTNRENEVADLEIELANTIEQTKQDQVGLLEEGRDQLADAAAVGRAVLSENLLEIIYPIRFPSNKTCEVQVTTFEQLSSNTCIRALDSIEDLEELIVSHSGLALDADTILADLREAKTALESVRTLVINAQSIADGAIAFDDQNSVSFSEAQLAALKTPITAGRSSVEAGLQDVTSIIQRIENQTIASQSSIDTAQSRLNRAQDALVSAEADLELKIAGSTPEQIAAAEAKVRQAEANLTSQEARIKQAQTAPSAQQARIDLASANLNSQAAQIKREQANKSNILAQIEKTVILAPFSGIITLQDADVGEIIPANQTVVGLISDAAFEIEANIPEVDIAKISLDDVAEITLDAYGSEELFAAKVVRIDPAETIIDDVTNYQVLFQFDAFDDRVRSGMTANIELLTQTWTDVLFVPEFVLLREEGSVSVRKLVGEDPALEESLQMVPVTLGERSTDGFRIIQEGLEEGDRIIHVFED